MSKRNTIDMRTEPHHSGPRKSVPRHPRPRAEWDKPLTEQEANRDGGWLRRQLVSMDTRFTEAMSQRGHDFAGEDEGKQ